MDRLAEMITAQRDLQVNTYGHKFDTMTDEERIQFIKDTVMALSDELHELLGEVGWKPWAKSRHINGAEYCKELVDAWHFFMNLLIVVDMTPEELYDGYFTKRLVNQERQRNDYDGVSTKMPCCKRAVEDISFTEVRKSDGTLDFIMCVCGVAMTDDFIRLVVRD